MNGSTASRIAARLYQELLVNCTHAIDFHTGSLHRTNIPQVRGDLGSRAVITLAHSFGPDVLVHNPGQKGTLRRVLSDRRVPTILYEAGEAMRLQRDHIQEGVDGTRRVMQSLGMLVPKPVPIEAIEANEAAAAAAAAAKAAGTPEGTPAVVATTDAAPTDVVEAVAVKPAAPASPKKPKVFLQTRWIRAEHGGLLELHVGIGSDVKKGDLIGTITDPLQNSRNEVRAKMDGHVIGAVMAPMVIPGLAVIHLGIAARNLDSTEAETVEVDEDRPE